MSPAAIADKPAERMRFKVLIFIFLSLIHVVPNPAASAAADAP
jgi:hypothetical protein